MWFYKINLILKYFNIYRKVAKILQNVPEYFLPISPNVSIYIYIKA